MAWANNWQPAANQWHGGRDDKDEESALHSTLSTLNSRIEKIPECHLAMMQNISNLNNNMMEMNRKLGQVYSLALEIGAEQKEMKKKMQLIQEQTLGTLSSQKWMLMHHVASERQGNVPGC